jgi:outer membrane receptor protein involved in Fe transport
MNSARSLLLTCAAFGLLMSAPSHAQSSAGLSSDITPQPLTDALSELAAQTGLQVFYVSDIASTQMSHGAPRGLAVRQALERLLDGTGLAFEFLNERSVRIFAPAARPHEQQVPRAPAMPSPDRGAPRLAALEEVVVTARRRAEPLANVPISAAVWTQEAMEASGVKGIDQIGALTPGVEFDFAPLLGDYFTDLVIRGVTDMHGTATSVFLDDTPLPPGRGETFLRSFPFAFDLDRIEVLRGPQGGLLSQDALGGAIRFIVNQPSLTTYSGLARMEAASTAYGEPSYELGAAAGGPLIPDALGFRISGWNRADGGYIDRVDPFTGETDHDANEAISTSVRGALTWVPSPSLRLTPSLAWQSIRYRESSLFYEPPSIPEDGKFVSTQQTQERSEDEFYVAALRLAATINHADLSTVVSYLGRRAVAAFDLGFSAGLDQRVFSLETRLSSSDTDATLGWLAGLWYSNSQVGEGGGSGKDWTDFDRSTVTDQTQVAGFGQLSYRVTQRATASAGVRVGSSHYDSVTRIPPPERVDDTDTSVTPRFGLTYQSDDYGMFYVTVAKGYRSGGVYAPVGGCEVGLAPYPADSLWSYEVGSKSNLLDGRLDLDASLFHITWEDHEPPVQGGCIDNSRRPGGAAVSNGFTVAARAYPTERVRVGLSLAYVDAHYTETVRSGDDVIIEDGDAIGQLPRVPSPWSVTASIEHDFAVAQGVTVTLHAEDILRSENPGPFYSHHPASPYYSPSQQPNPSTNVLNLRAVFAWPRMDAALFVNNALNSHPLLSAEHLDDPPLSFATTFRPRTIGVSTNWRF